MEKQQKKVLMWAGISGAVILIILVVAFIYSTNLRERQQLNDEARREAEKHLQSRIIKCGDYYYAKMHLSWVDYGKVYTKNRLMQFESVSALAQESDEPLTAQDKAEGILWKGHVVTVNGKFREYDLGKQKWENWKEDPLAGNPLFEIPLYRTRSGWMHLSVSNIKDLKVPPQKFDITCADIPK